MNHPILQHAERYPGWHSYSEDDTRTYIAVLHLSKSGKIKVEGNRFKAA